MSEQRLVVLSEEERERLRWIANYIVSDEVAEAWGDEFSDDAALLRSLTDRFEDGLDGAEAHEVSGMFFTNWKPGEIDHGHPLYTGYLKLRQISDEEHPRYSQQTSDYHGLADRLTRSLSHPTEEGR